MEIFSIWELNCGDILSLSDCYVDQAIFCGQAPDPIHKE
jgi:hypothetical protein